MDIKHFLYFSEAAKKMPKEIVCLIENQSMAAQIYLKNQQT